MLLGTVEVVECVPTETYSDALARSLWDITGVKPSCFPTGLQPSYFRELTAQERAFGDYSARRWAWVTRDPQRFTKK